MLTDRFDVVLGAGRGNAHDPPASSAAPIASLASFYRRMLVGVTGTLDTLDDVGRVGRRVTGTVTFTGEPQVPFFDLTTDDGKQHYARYPTRAYDCLFDGPTLTCTWERWRFTFLDETNAQPRLVAPSRVPVPLFAFGDIRRQLAGHWSLAPNGHAPRWVYWRDVTSPGPLFCRTVDRVAGRWWSFVCVPAGRGSASGNPTTYRLAPESMSGHALRRDATSRAQRLFATWQEDGGKPWR